MLGGLCWHWGVGGGLCLDRFALVSCLCTEAGLGQRLVDAWVCNLGNLGCQRVSS